MVQQDENSTVGFLPPHEPCSDTCLVSMKITVSGFSLMLSCPVLAGGAGLGTRGQLPASFLHFTNAQSRRYPSCQETPPAAKSNVVPRAKDPVFVSQDCRKKSPPTQWFKVTDFYVLTILEARRLRSRCHEGLTASRGSRGEFFLCPSQLLVTVSRT